MPALIAPCFEGPIDIVGDVHGEIDALRQLLQQLGYDEQGLHPEGRRLVFIGDLADRGPDSPAVIELVRDLVGRGVAQCLLGNHELMLLLNESKEGCRWFVDPSHPEQQPGGKFAHSRVAPAELKPVWQDFFASLPLVLERADLRLVHAAWQPDAIDLLRAEQRSVRELYHACDAAIEAELLRDGTAAQEAAEKAQYADMLGRSDGGTPPLLQGIARASLRRNLGHPLRVLTFGPDKPASAPFYVMERWRMCTRLRWWEEYQDETPVVMGHYWRKARQFTRQGVAPRMPSVFDDLPPTAWLGPRRNVFCVDFSVGARFVERKAGATQFETRLAALRWPERELWFETGRVA